MAPDPSQIAAVRAVLYERNRLRKLFDHLDSIDVLMNLDPRRPLQPGDARGFAGSGPNWYIPHTGKLSPSVIEAADRCDRIADLTLEIRGELEHVDFPASDKRHLQTALTRQAAAMSARGTLWRATKPPANAKKAATTISGHLQASVSEFQHVAKYLKTVRPKDIR